MAAEPPARRCSCDVVRSHSCRQATATTARCRFRVTDLATYCEGVAGLAVEVGANVQPDQVVAVTYAPGMERMAHAIAERAYERGARFVDPIVFDGNLKRIRLERAREETLSFVPEWWGQRTLALGE